MGTTATKTRYLDPETAPRNALGHDRWLLLEGAFRRMASASAPPAPSHHLPFAAWREVLAAAFPRVPDAVAHASYAALDAGHGNRADVFDASAAFAAVLGGAAHERARFVWATYDPHRTGSVSKLQVAHMTRLA